MRKEDVPVVVHKKPLPKFQKRRVTAEQVNQPVCAKNTVVKSGGLRGTGAGKFYKMGGVKGIIKG